jgi:XTP/dITP diphosphohydrolase
MRLVIATKNESKFKEIKKILKGLNLTIVSLNQLDKKIKIKEDGISFFENALKKAMAVSEIYKDDYVVGEDSGLEIGYLKGAPGIFSKRYSGKKSTPYKNNLKVLNQLRGVDRKKRKASFKCCLVLVKNCKLIKKFEGKLAGFINEEIRGRKGFGYDPVFYLTEYKKTVAELSRAEKNKISHRAKAFGKLKRYLINRLKTKD